jgi:tRNA threonylcarbamoyladenosine biosynthesis protein TsaB
VVAVDTLLAVAHQSDLPTPTLQIISDAQRNELFVGRFECSAGGRWTRTKDIEIVPVEEWIAALAPVDVVSGPGLSKLGDRVRSSCVLMPQQQWCPTAHSVAELGEQAARDGHADDVWTLEPLYLRRSAAEEKADTR